MKCPNCQSSRIMKAGFGQGVQIHRCVDCGYRFKKGSFQQLTLAKLDEMDKKLDELMRRKK